MPSPLFSPEDARLVADLHALEKKSPKLVRSSVYPAPAEPNTLIRSWKLNEFKYYDIPSPFPTLARGLFSTQLDADGPDRADARYRIVARGYDKFFNIGEVPWTTWEALETHTAPPYTLSLKSNGCIIFIAALTPRKLLITSKHSLGPVVGVETSHAQAGEMWVRRYLEEKGRSEEDLAARLWKENWTAVAELCDDSFEEHVLAYPPDRTGLHLHGLNIATKSFQTMTHDIVDAFADEWGFIKTKTHTVDSINAVREFTSHVAEVGEWDGEAVEGFVVRTCVTEPPVEGRNRAAAAASKGESPYAPGSSFFFKVKFDEPYMMYRDWREVTKMLLTAKGPMLASALPKSKMKRKETKVYVKWVIEEIKKNRKAFSGYTKGHGIIATRERFLKWLEEESGSTKLKEEEEEEEEGRQGNKGEKIEKAIIVPVAIPGCGKTSVAVALAHIFGFGHTQSDDLRGKKTAPFFIKKVTGLLKNHNVVIADKNNHLKQHRQQLREAVAKYSPPVHLIALNWSLDKPPAMIHRICSDRVVNRGDNHQTLTADASIARKHEEVIWMFIDRTEELADTEVDVCVEMDVEEDLEGSVRRAVDGLWRVLGGSGGLLGEEKPSEEKIREGLEMVGAYVPASRLQEVEERKKEKKAEPRYFGLLPEVNVKEVLEAVFSRQDNTDGSAFWEKLKDAKRVKTRPHITIVHSKSLPAEKEVWDLCQDVNALQDPPSFRCKFGKVLWDGRVMVLTVESLELADAETKEEGRRFLDGLPEATRRRLHVTVGTENESISPVEGKTLVEKWRQDEVQGKEGIWEADLEGGGGGGGIVVGGRLKGLFS